jgi:peptide/nickel transport system permease protein
MDAPAGVEALARSRVRRRLDAAVWRVRRNPLTIAGFLLAAALIAVALAGPFVVPYDPVQLDPPSRLQPPSRAHPMGTDNFGRDVLSRVVAATGLDLGIAIVSVGLAFGAGLLLGCLAGYGGGVLDHGIMRVVEVVQSFPPFILAIGLAAALGGGLANIVYVVALIQVPVYTRLVRADILSARGRPWVDAAVCAGCSGWQLVLLHILPNTLPPVLVQVAINMSWAILNAAGLSFIGLGVKPPTPEWGVMIREGMEFAVSGEWWVPLFPGLAIFLAIFCFNLIADGLRDILDPRLRD